MKEVLRLVDAEQRGSRSATLRKYNLEIFAGEVVVVYGLAGNGLHALLDLMDGSEGLSGGRIYIGEEPAPLRRDEGKLWRRIYICGDLRKQFEQMTVAENLDLLSGRHKPWKLYQKRRVLERARRYLNAEGLDIDPEVRLETLSRAQRLCLNLLQAKMAHASLVVLDSTGYIFSTEGNGAVEQMILRLKAEGMSFLLVSYRDDLYDALKPRIQRISYGADVMEWRYPRHTPEKGGRSAPAPAAAARGAEGFLDEWINYADPAEYLTAVRQKNPAYWNDVIRITVPGKGLYADGNTVLIPRDSAWRFTENLSVADNLILPIRDRIGRGAAAYIPPRLVASAAEEFYRVAGIDPGKRRIRDLNLLERKLLSIYRWEQARPKVMVLETPHFGLDRIESRRIDEYIAHLLQRGIRVLILSSSPDTLKRLCGTVTVTEMGARARRWQGPGKDKGTVS